jgi:hypothetical protein
MVMDVAGGSGGNRLIFSNYKGGWKRLPRIYVEISHQPPEASQSIPVSELGVTCGCGGASRRDVI